jgi:DNA gyrase subunit A
VKTINVTDKTGGLVGILDVTPQEDLMITCKSGITIRMGVSGISELGRATQGVKLIRLDDGDSIAGITQLDEEGTVEAAAAASGAIADPEELSGDDAPDDGSAGGEETPVV